MIWIFTLLARSDVRWYNGYHTAVSLFTAAPKRLFVRLWLQHCGGTGRLVIVLRRPRKSTSETETWYVTCFDDTNSRSKLNSNSLEQVGRFLYNSSLLSCSPTSQFSVVFSPPPAESGRGRNIHYSATESVFASLAAISVRQVWFWWTSTHFSPFWEKNRKPFTPNTLTMEVSRQLLRL